MAMQGPQPGVVGHKPDQNPPICVGGIDTVVCVVGEPAMTRCQGPELVAVEMGWMGSVIEVIDKQADRPPEARST